MASVRNKLLQATNHFHIFAKLFINAFRSAFELHVQEVASILEFISFLQILNTELGDCLRAFVLFIVDKVNLFLSLDLSFIS